jgi:hypothetical protein
MDINNLGWIIPVAYNPLRNSGHESGDFVFVRKQPSKKP